jgi:tRNA(Arg) A34 adenosine deaminase TadA
MLAHDAALAALAGNDFMAAALAAARRALLAGEPPVGACLVLGGEVLATGANSVIGSLDVTAHAEINVLRQATARLRSPTIAHANLYVTVEPCAMCIGACHYAGIARVFYGASLADLNEVTGNEFLAAPVAAAGLPELRGGMMRNESLALLGAWQSTGARARTRP